MQKTGTFEYMNNALTAIGIMILLLYTYNSCAKYQAPGNGLLKKRVLNRKTETNMVHVLDSFQTNSLKEALDRMDGVGKLLNSLHANNVPDALTKLNRLQTDIKSLLTALEVEDAQEGIAKANKIKSTLDQLNRIQQAFTLQ